MQAESSKAGSTVHPVLYFAPEPASRKRRVPDALRQRVETSCDRCKIRKRKCIRASDHVPCQACEEAKTECRSTLPRKRRAVPTQSAARYSLLDSIIRKLYPDEAVDNIADLESLAKRLGADDSRPNGPRGEDEGSSLDQDPGGEQDPEPSEQGDFTVDRDTFGPNRTPTSDIPEGWLVAAPKGGHHYVGSASLVYFARCARELVAKSNLLRQPTYDEQGLRRYLQAAEFTTYRISHTIEANLQGHPATVAAESTQSPSARVDTSSSSRLGMSPMSDAARHPRDFDRLLSDRLVAAFFDRVHRNFPLLHRSAFQLQYERSFGQINLTKEPGWACVLLMIYTLGAQALEDELADSQALQQHYLYIIIREGLGRLVITSTLANVQALLLLALYQHNAGERNTAWVLIGLALRSAVALGLHRNGANSDFDPFERNLRRMVWWQLHLFEQYISLALGRPSLSDVISVDAALPDPSFEAGMGLLQGYVTSHVALSRLIVKVKQVVATVAVAYIDPQKLVDWYPVIMEIHGEIIAWKKSQPASLSLGQVFANPSDRRLILILLIWADYLESVLCRAYLLCRVNQSFEGTKCSAEIEKVANLSVTAAQASATKLLVLADHGLLEGSVWLDFYAIQHAIMITAVHMLSSSPTQDFLNVREPIERLISLSRKMKLAPTYRITMNVAIQLSCIAGIDVDQSTSSDMLHQMMPMDLSQQANGGLHNMGLTIPEISSDSQVNDSTGFNQLEQLFGPIFPSRGNSPPDVFADLYNLGYNADATNSWDFFNIGKVADGALQAMQQGSQFPQFFDMPTTGAPTLDRSAGEGSNGASSFQQS